jgi:hypothetical protein
MTGEGRSAVRNAVHRDIRMNGPSPLLLATIRTIDRFTDRTGTVVCTENLVRLI